MAKLSIHAGTTSKTLDIFVQDTSVTTGAGLTGLTNLSSSLTWYYYREGANASVQVTPIASATLGTWTTKGFIVVDGTGMPGLYQIGVPDAALAAGAASVKMMLKGATNMAPVVIEIELTAVDNQTANLTAAQIATGVWQDATSGDFTVSSSIGKSLYTSGNAPGAASGIALVGSNMGSITGALTAAQIATGVWQDTTAGDFTTSASIGKSVMNGVALGTGLTVNDLTTKTGFSLSQTFPTNFSALGIGAGGHITTVDTVTTVTNQLTAAAIATGVWTDTTAGDFTTSLSIGKSIMNGVTLGTGLTVAAVSGNVTFGNTSIGTVTNLTNLPSIPANWLTATGIAASALNGKGDWNIGKTGYSISGTLTTLDGLATHGDSSWATATGFATPTNITAGTITTVTSVTGLTASDVGAIKAKTDNLPAAPADESLIIAATNSLATSIAALPTTTTVNAIKAKTDNLPASPAAIGSAMTLSGAYDAAKTAASQTTADGIKTVTDALVSTGGKLWVLNENGNPVASAAAVAALPTTSSVMSADIVKINGGDITGSGIETTDEWRPA